MTQTLTLRSIPIDTESTDYITTPNSMSSSSSNSVLERYLVSTFGSPDGSCFLAAAAAVLQGRLSEVCIYMYIYMYAYIYIDIYIA